MSLRGYWRTLSERIACRPAIRITRLTTIARTGRLMKRSVIFISCPRFGLRIVRRLYFVVDFDGSAVTQLKHSRAYHFIARIKSRYDGYLVTARTSHFHELLSYSQVGLAFRVLKLSDKENRIAVRRVGSCGGGQRDDLAIRSYSQFHLNKHAGSKFALGIRESRLHLNVAGGFIYH